MLLGTDISHWEDDPTTPKEIDFEMMKQAGAWYCIFKATQAKFTDKVFEISWADCKGVLPRGAYCYLDYTKSGVEQAEYFLSVIANDPPELPPICDFECRVNVPANANGQLWNWLTIVERATKRVPIIYTSPAYWAEYGSRNTGWSHFPLWIANYRVPKPAIPKPWSDYLFWQFTDRGAGGIYGVEAKGIDLNYYNGTLEQLGDLCGDEEHPVLTLEERVTALEEAARQEGWNV